MRHAWWLALVLIGCVSDPRDPKTWIKKLGDPREGKDAINQLVKLKNAEAVDPLIAHYKRTKDPEVLKAIATFKDKRQVGVMVDALDYSQDSCDAATTAANALGDTPDPQAVEPLTKALTKPLPIQTRCNVVKLEAMKSLVKIGDKRAVPALVKVLETSAAEQDFFLNKQAAVALGKLADPSAVPALIRGLFMTGRGAGIFQECRTALLAIGEPAVDPIIETMQRKNAKIEADAKQNEFIPGIVTQKTAILLGDLRSKKAVKPLLDELAKKDEGLAAGPGKGVSGHQSVILALGFIGDASVGKTLQGILNDPKRNNKHRAAAAEALNALGDTSALPSLLKIANEKFITGTTVDPDKGALVAAAVTAYSRLAGAENADVQLQKIPPEIVDMDEVFDSAKLRLEAAKECKADLGCYAKLLRGKENVKAEKAALMIARQGKAGVPELAKNVNHPDPAVRMTVLFGLQQSADKSCSECTAALEKQIANDAAKVSLKGVVDEMRAVLASISHR